MTHFVLLTASSFKPPDSIVVLAVAQWRCFSLRLLSSISLPPSASPLSPKFESRQRNKSNQFDFYLSLVARGGFTLHTNRTCLRQLYKIHARGMQCKQSRRQGFVINFSVRLPSLPLRRTLFNLRVSVGQDSVVAYSAGLGGRMRKRDEVAAHA